MKIRTDGHWSLILHFKAINRKSNLIAGLEIREMFYPDNFLSFRFCLDPAVQVEWNILGTLFKSQKKTRAEMSTTNTCSKQDQAKPGLQTQPRSSFPDKKARLLPILIYSLAVAKVKM